MIPEVIQAYPRFKLVSRKSQEIKNGADNGRLLRHGAVFSSATKWAAAFYDRDDSLLQASPEEYYNTSRLPKACIYANTGIQRQSSYRRWITADLQRDYRL
jgi:hypothetical protein